MEMSQPFNPKDSPKLTPEYYNKECSNDFRYNKILANIPRRHITPGGKTKVYNNHSLDSLMHGNEWNDMQPDFQIEEPMSSNHFFQHGGHMRAFYLFVYSMIFMVGKFLLQIKIFVFCIFY